MVLWKIKRKVETSSVETKHRKGPHRFLVSSPYYKSSKQNFEDDNNCHHVPIQKHNFKQILVAALQWRTCPKYRWAVPLILRHGRGKANIRGKSSSRPIRSK